MIALLAALLLQGAVPAAQAPRAQGSAGRAEVQMGLTVRPDTVTVGDPFTVMVRVRAPLGASIAFPAGPDSGASVEATDQRTLQRGADTTASELTAIYRVAAWDTGVVRLGLGDVAVSGSVERVIPLASASVYVRSVLPQDTAKQIPKPPREPFGAKRPWWHWLLLALLVAAIIGVLLWWYLRRRRRGPAPVPVEDPYVVAEREFARIEGLGLLEAGERGRFVALVVEVLRGYLAARFPAAALSLTSTELIRAMRAHPEVPAQRLAALLYEADLVKFARRPVTAEHGREIGSEAHALVRDVQEAVTRPPDEARAA
ncbi:MAG TPA: hypothetical protein VFS05_09725 [Gemmatimonadaceae bacterium]|nr:hypothetical protein [Gemmatimonadaceae bacterium]